MGAEGGCIPRRSVRELPMPLFVKDFGCVPDGRVLQRGAIQAGSVVLTDPGTILRDRRR